MARKRTLNERRLTKRQVQELIASGAQPRADLTAAFESGLLRPLVYELAGDRYLMVFGELSGLGGKGDIYSATTFVGSCAGARRLTTMPGMGVKARSAIGLTIRCSKIG
jgi:hypothetical protein